MPWRQLVAWTALPLALVIGSGIMILRDRAAPRVTVLVEGGAMHGTEGLTFGPDGMMYVASLNGLAVMKVDPKTGAVSTAVGPPDAEPDEPGSCNQITPRQNLQMAGGCCPKKALIV